ncbi:hypothetical protein GUITHDRAFT_120783 [Guillardia theta CCMP2712]|uniref:Uncharacterized protein n=1 Tax=Guillardia theta (strain CCMP2712) TaxID=905079 RepID=L1I9W5_GUITC|nr:hypothetical protein GUITHDRAFT_120783 [Guillardia theta CCMP2712]EKX33046.1 hypothetical protein GUITHDRAFT_120783 [Guillardia theta CCMP2712]|eukprot:XP_005820026.1 hypothetical protein GUITHDRAFT_120783 [Guillardia theta CCMP2712]
MSTPGGDERQEGYDGESNNSSNSYATVASSGSNVAQRLMELDGGAQEAQDEAVTDKSASPSMHQGSASVLVPDFSFRPRPRSSCSHSPRKEDAPTRREEVVEKAQHVQAHLRACGFEGFPMNVEDKGLSSDVQDRSATMSVTEDFMAQLLMKLEEVIVQYKKRGVLVEDFLTGDKSPLKHKQGQEGVGENSPESFADSRFSPLTDSSNLFLLHDSERSKKSSPDSHHRKAFNQCQIDWSCTQPDQGQQAREDELLLRIDEMRRKEAKLMHILHEKEQMLEQCQERLRIMLKENDRRKETALKVVRATQMKLGGKEKATAGLDPRTASLIHELAEMNHALERDKGRLEEENKSVMARLRDMENAMTVPLRGRDQEAVNFGRLREELIKSQRVMEELSDKIRQKESEAQVANSRKESILASYEQLQERLKMMEAQHEETPKPEYVDSLERAMWSMEKEMAQIKHRLKSDLNVFKDLGLLLGTQDHSNFIPTIRDLKKKAAEMEVMAGRIHEVFMELPMEERVSCGEVKSEDWDLMLTLLAERKYGTKITLDARKFQEEQTQEQENLRRKEEDQKLVGKEEEAEAIAVLAEIEAVLSQRVSPLALNAIKAGKKHGDAHVLGSQGKEVVEEVRDLVAYERCCLARTFLEGEEEEEKEEEKVCRELLMQVQALLGVDSVSSILPKISWMREMAKEADRARASLLLMLQLPLDASWQDCMLALKRVGTDSKPLAPDEPPSTQEVAKTPSPDKQVRPVETEPYSTKEEEQEEQEREQQEYDHEQEKKVHCVRPASARRQKPVAWELRLDSHRSMSMREDMSKGAPGAHHDLRRSLQVTLVPLPEEDPSSSSPRASQGVLQEACGRHLLARARMSAGTALQPPRRWRPRPVSSTSLVQAAGKNGTRTSQRMRSQR